MKYFGSSGIRGEFPSGISPAVGMRVGYALGSMIPGGRFLLGYDVRTTSGIISMSIASSLISSGCDVMEGGLVSTPTLAFNTRYFDAGIMVTASHNPPQYNGIKLWNPDGSSFNTEQMMTVEKYMDEKRKDLPGFKGLGSVSSYLRGIARHIGFILERVVPGRRLPVVVDCGNGAGSTITPLLLEKMGASVTGVNTHPDGRFPGRGAEPAAEALGTLCSCVKMTGSKLGIAHDGDADRMVAIDEKGTIIPPDYLIALFSREVKAKKVVVPVDCSMCVDHYLTGVDVIRTRVGDVFISEMMKKVGARFGGEPSGTYIFPEVSYAPEGVFSAAYLYSIVSEQGDLSTLIEGIPHYPVLRKSISFTGDPIAVSRRIKKGVYATSCNNIDETDGYRLEFDDGWVLIRLSGTEPKVRLMAEGIDKDTVNTLLKIGEKIVEGSIRGVKK